MVTLSHISKLRNLQQKKILLVLTPFAFPLTGDNSYFINYMISGCSVRYAASCFHSRMEQIVPSRGGNWHVCVSKQIPPWSIILFSDAVIIFL